MIVVSPLAKGGGYVSTNRYTHASTLRTIQEIFGVLPFLAGAATAPSLSELFQEQATNPPAFTSPALQADGQFHVTLVGLSPGRTNVVETSANLSSWVPLATNVSETTTADFTDPRAESILQRFYRLVTSP